MFRFDYQPEFLKWSLQPPGWKRDWHVGVRVEKSNKLVGFISAIPSKLKSYDKVLKVVDINFLCVHKKLRSKRVAPVLIRQGAVHAAQRELCRGRRRHVPFRLPARIPQVVAAAAGLETRLACGRAGGEVQQTGWLHLGHTQ